MKAVFMVLAIIFAAALAGGITYAVTDPSKTVKDGALNTKSQRSTEQDNLQLVVAGFARPIANGDSVPVSGDIVAMIKVDRGNERYSRSLDLYLYNQSSSQPVEGAKVQILGQMRYMDHGTFHAVPLQSGSGHYILPLGFVMPGEWQIDLDIQASGKQNRMQIQIDFFE